MYSFQTLVAVGGGLSLLSQASESMLERAHLSTMYCKTAGRPRSYLKEVLFVDVVDQWSLIYEQSSASRVVKQSFRKRSLV